MSAPVPATSTTSRRPVSSAVANGGSNGTPSHRHRQQRASHTVVSSPGDGSSAPSSSSPPSTDVYSHPAAVAYAAAHPRRTIPKFGPYLLLQTLGEGEFGKVKLGLHTQWGEEVAVKLIRRGNVDSQVRMSKVEREIEVLRSLKHPNIVRLYDVIETDKYIGIILEYASGGELFDHILAHRYLREKDAARLFSQLISGVYYIHKKKIVHRDLKLENLLLDRNRNVIITDFGFANRFEHRADDLMQTSCGSPCYAAPELVISEGLYVGSAVDIWSCGVILYAMLAGYLPFDDDPQNPDGDNINLLYKYIVNTPLSFPDYISPSARSILQLMLVPDPKRRASLEEVMRHPWLAEFNNAGEFPMGSAFGKSVADLERIAMEQHQVKRMAYQRQMKAASAARHQREQQSQSQQQPRSASHQPIYATNGNGAGPMDVDDPFAGPKVCVMLSGYISSISDLLQDTKPIEPSVEAAPTPALTTDTSPRKDRKQQRKDEGRHTIQVEYTPASPAGARDPKGKRKASTPPEDMSVDTEHQQTPTKTRRASPSSSSPMTKPLPTPPTSPPVPPSSYVPVEDVYMADAVQDVVIPIPSTPVVSSPPATPIAFASAQANNAVESSGGSKKGHGRMGSISNKFGGIMARVPTLNGNNDKEKEETLSPGTVTPTSSVSQEDRETQKEKDKEGKKSRRNTLNLVVGTIRRGAGRMSGSVSQASTRTSSKGTETETSDAIPLPPPPTAPPSTMTPSIVGPAPSSEDLAQGPGVSTKKAKKVMQWFRQGRSSMGVATAASSSEILPSEEKRSRKKSSTMGPSTPSLLDTSISADPTTVSPITPTPGPKQRTGERTPSFVSRFTRGSMGVVGGGSRIGGGTPNGKEKAIRVHHGAVDQTMITSRPPVDVMKSVREVLIGMGVEVAVEGEYKFRVVRVKRPKGSTSGVEVAAFVASGTAASGGVDPRGLPVPQQRESGLLRGLLTMRRQSSQVGNTSVMSVESATEESSAEGVPNASASSTTIGGQGPIYGPQTADMHDEVRFSVELTRLDRLKDTYSLDVRRLKGNLRSYKFLYEVLRE
ncbi:Pkinase-domain-containing protein [Flagelloscypha sp. PMI_526]|nr:Pkinase-domain-containing protein [Flagelloscypha sp. PMI_526]